MDWTGIIVALISSGALLAIFTLAEKKSGMMLDNANKLAESYKSLAEEYQAREATTQSQMLQAREELMAQVRMNSSLRHSLDDAHTELAVCKIMYCKDSSCVKRNPPFGCNAEAVVRNTKDLARKAYAGRAAEKEVPNEEDHS